MQQKRYMKVDDLLAGAAQLSAGAAIHAVSLGLVVGTKPSIDAEIMALTNAIDALRQGRHDLRELRTTLTAKQREGYNLANIIRDSLKRSFGRSYNPLWEGSGLNQSLQVPRAVGRLEETLRSLKSFLTDNPEHELEDVATAALADAAANALQVTRLAVQSKKSAVRGMVTARMEKEQVVRSRIRIVVEELKRVIGPIDARWDAFGLHQPGLDQTPPQPAKVTIDLKGNGEALVKWPKTARADYHRIWLKVVSVDETPNPVGTAADLDFMLENLQSGQQVEVSISAVNNGGESQRSEPRVVTVT